MKLSLAYACLFLLTACVGPGPGITGNDTGGIIPYPLVASQGGSDRAVAQAMASEHCARYHKFAKITSIHRQMETTWDSPATGPSLGPGQAPKAIPTRRS